MTDLRAFSYENFAHSDHHPVSIVPFTSVDIQNEGELISWLQETSHDLSQYYASYRDMYKDNINVYAGNVLNNSSVFPNKRNNELNIIQPIVESHVSRVTSSRAHVSVLPTHADQYSDLVSAQVAEKVLQMSFEHNKVTSLVEDAVRHMLVCGHSYIAVEWDDNAGKIIDRLKESVPILDEEDNPLEDDNGFPLMHNPRIREGDIKYRVMAPYEVLEQPGEWESNKDWLIHIEFVDVHKLQENYPKVAPLIHPTPVGPSFDSDMFLNSLGQDDKRAIVYTLYHRSTPAFPNGRLIKATSEVVLENVDLPYPSLNDYSLLPVVRVHDRRVPGFRMPLPMTVMEAGKNHQRLFNRISHNINRDMSLRVPKWFNHVGSGVRPSQLNNSESIVTWKGEPWQKPTFESPPSVSNEQFAYRDKIMSELQVNTGSSHIMNEPPPNTRAAQMLQHQEEQEFRRAEPLIRHVNDFIAELGRITLAVMADTYMDDDERVIRLVGGTSIAAVQNFKTSDLLGPFDVKYERTSALPESKQGRLNEATRMYQLGLIDDQQYKKIIGFNEDPDFVTAETKAYEKQILENDLMRRGEKVEAPLEHEDHVEHLRAMYPLIQSVEFSEMPDQIKEGIIGHAMAHELFAWKRAQVSFNYSLKVNKHVEFLFFSALPEAVPIQAGNPVPGDDTMKNRANTPGLGPQGRLDPTDQPGPANPEAI